MRILSNFPNATLLPVQASVKIAERPAVANEKLGSPKLWPSYLPVRLSVKNRFSLALLALIIFAVSLPAFVLAQQKQNQSNTSAGTSSTGKTGAPTAPPGRRPRVRNPNNPTEAVNQDFGEALSVIQQNYIAAKTT